MYSIGKKEILNMTWQSYMTKLNQEGKLPPGAKWNSAPFDKYDERRLKEWFWKIRTGVNMTCKEHPERKGNFMPVLVREKD